MPPRLEEGVLYVSLEHTVIMHLCACGCGNEVALPLSPTDWRLTYDGQSISVRPSIGSWSLPCRSHYFIDGGRVVWAGDWTDAEIAHGRALDRSRRATRDRRPIPRQFAGLAGETRTGGWTGKGGVEWEMPG